MPDNIEKLELDFTKLGDDILAALKKDLHDGISEVTTLVRSQSRKLGTMIKMIASERIFGDLKDDEELFEHFQGRLKAHAEELAKTVAGMTILTIQTAWNNIVGIVWGALNGLLTSRGLPPATIPGL